MQISWLSFAPFFKFHNLVTLFSFASTSFDLYVYFKLKKEQRNLYSLIFPIKLYFQYLITKIGPLW